MGMSRTGKLIASCCGAAIVVAAAGVVWIGVEEGRTASGLVPAKLGPEEAGGVTSPASTQGVPGQPTAGAQNATVGPVPIPGTEGTVPGSITESLVLQKGETYYDKGEAFFKDGDKVDHRTRALDAIFAQPVPVHSLLPVETGDTKISAHVAPWSLEAVRAADQTR